MISFRNKNPSHPLPEALWWGLWIIAFTSLARLRPVTLRPARPEPRMPEDAKAKSTHFPPAKIRIFGLDPAERLKLSGESEPEKAPNFKLCDAPGRRRTTEPPTSPITRIRTVRTKALKAAKLAGRTSGRPAEKSGAYGKCGFFSRRVQLPRAAQGAPKTRAKIVSTCLK
mgnify:CR=1 FL=1